MVRGRQTRHIFELRSPAGARDFYVFTARATQLSTGRERERVRWDEGGGPRAEPAEAEAD
jgi:hypothetical protein